MSLHVSNVTIFDLFFAHDIIYQDIAFLINFANLILIFAIPDICELLPFLPEKAPLIIRCLQMSKNVLFANVSNIFQIKDICELLKNSKYRPETIIRLLTSQLQKTKNFAKHILTTKWLTH